MHLPGRRRPARRARPAEPNLIGPCPPASGGTGDTAFPPAGGGDERGGRLRLFIAAPIPQPWIDWLVNVQKALERELPDYFRRTAPESWHLTVLFLGWQPAERLDQLSDAAADVAAAAAAPRLTMGDLGSPPPISRPRLVWIRCEDGGVLADAQRRLLSRLEPFGLELDYRPFVGHITLGRARRPSRIDFSAALTRARRQIPKSPDPQRIDELALFRSHLSPSGAHYEALRRCPMRG